MLTIFNRRELTVTFSMAQQAEICQALTAAGIKYHLRTRQDAPDGRGALPRGVRDTEYIFYVHKDDLDAAQAAVARA